MSDTDGYHLRRIPEGIAPLGPSFRWHSGIIDYGQHPAYAGLISSAGLPRRIAALVTYGRHLALLLAKRLLKYEMIPTEHRQGRGIRARLGFAGHALRHLVTPGGSGKREEEGAVGQALKQSGVAVVTMPTDRIAQLEAAAAPFFEALRARRGAAEAKRAFDESRSTTGRQAAPALYALIEDILAESGLLASVSGYMGRKAKLVDVNPQINDPSDSFWREIFDDLDSNSLPATAYLHRDASGGDVKVIIYCSDVGERNGPFGYSVGSNRMTISKVDNFLCEANDHNGFSLTSLDARRRFAALPAKLRQKGLFGNDLKDGAPASNAVLESIWSITGDRGSMVLFDTKGIHRGGMVKEGERLVITCVLG